MNATSAGSGCARSAGGEHLCCPGIIKADGQMCRDACEVGCVIPGGTLTNPVRPAPPCAGSGTVKPLSGMNIALLLIGELRGFLTHQYWPTWEMHVGRVIRREGGTLITLLCTEEGNQTIPTNLVRALNIVDLQRESFGGRIPSFRRAESCYRRALHFEASSGIRISTFLRGRPDAIW